MYSWDLIHGDSCPKRGRLRVKWGHRFLTECFFFTKSWHCYQILLLISQRVVLAAKISIRAFFECSRLKAWCYVSYPTSVWKDTMFSNIQCPVTYQKHGMSSSSHQCEIGRCELCLSAIWSAKQEIFVQPPPQKTASYDLYWDFVCNLNNKGFFLTLLGV